MVPKAWQESSLLGERDVRIYRRRVEAGTRQGQARRGWLSDAERGRAEGFRFDMDRVRYVARAAFRREVLAGFLGLDPASLHLVEGAHGKPRIDPSQACGLHFNSSHAGGEILLAVARGPVGVDVEEHRDLAELPAMAERIMDSGELRAFAALPPPDRLPAFYRLWCRKEAVLKALGEGFSRDPASIRVGLDPSPPGVIQPAEDPLVREFGAVADLPAPPGFAAAVCAAGTDWRVSEGIPPLPPAAK